MTKRMFLRVVAVAVCGAVLAVPIAAEKKEKEKAGEGTKDAKWAPAVKPKPLGQNVKRGLAWLADHQLPNGAWGQGEESTQMGGGLEMKDVSSVADTCTATLALIRSGSTPGEGPYAKNVRAAVDFVCGEIEEHPSDSLYITSTRNTRVQGKLGPYIDTFLAALMLAEVQEQMPDKRGLKRVSKALDKVLAKMQKHQRQDGTWDDTGWAPALAQGIAAKGLNRAAQQGKPVDRQIQARVEAYARKQFDRQSGDFSSAGSAGVELYSTAANFGALADSVNTNQSEEESVRNKLKNGSTAAERAQAETTLKRFAVARETLADAQQAVVKKLQDKQFIAGFGSNGGEEFLSYMSIGEGLVVKGGDQWKQWDRSISENMNRIQNGDGSWTGHHCITGRTFCTSAALLVLMVDRTPVPIAAKIGRR